MVVPLPRFQGGGPCHLPASLKLSTSLFCMAREVPRNQLSEDACRGEPHRGAPRREACAARIGEGGHGTAYVVGWVPAAAQAFG